ncbi:hypothetical protein HDU97_005779 [Phlyctochytrium planicorne]|nr:hypothetical protein HDU97_005779 [Phlyctochytrium planicorne]
MAIANLQNAGFAMATYDTIMKCFRTFPVSQVEKLGQVLALVSYFAVYPFLNLAKYSTPPLYSNRVNILERLAQVATDVAASNSVKSLYDLHFTIKSRLNQLNDPHIVYAPSCFSGVSFFQPWMLGMRFDPVVSGSLNGTANLMPTPTIYILGTSQSDSDFASARSSDFANGLNLFWRNQTGVEVDDYIGWTVESIDGYDAVTALRAFSNITGTSKDPETRFNLAFPGYSWSGGRLKYIDGFFYRRPSYLIRSNTVTYVIRSSTGDLKHVTAPWAGVIEDEGILKSLNDGANSYYLQYCASQEVDFGRRKRRDSGDGDDNGPFRDAEYPNNKRSSFWESVGVDEEDEEVRVATTPTTPAPDDTEALPPSFPFRNMQAISTNRTTIFTGSNSVSNGSMEPLQQYGGGSVFKLDNRTGVWMFSSLAPKFIQGQSKLDSHMGWLNDVFDSLKKLRDENVTNLVIDVTNNEGGIICLGMAAAQGLFREKPLVPMQYLYRALPELRILANLTTDTNSPFYLRKLRSVQNMARLNSTSDLFDPGENIKVMMDSGVLNDKFTNRFHLNCTGYIEDVKSMPAGANWTKFENVVVVSNGLCGSTCATFVRALKHQFGVRTYTYGSSISQPFQPTSYEGGTVVSFTDLRDNAYQFLNNPLSNLNFFKSFPFYVSGKIPFFQLIEPNMVDSGGQLWPAEWIPMKADMHVRVMNPMDPEMIWRGVAASEGW